MWQERDIESITLTKLIEQYKKQKANDIYSSYITSRLKLIENILPAISSVLPSMTDHGPEHIANVLDNCSLLLGLNNDTEIDINCAELFCLIHSVLYHDVGNIDGRDNHQSKIAKIYDFVHNPESQNKQEKRLILRIAAAHCGSASDGSKDTIKDIPFEPHNFESQPIQLRKISALVRFADELAEGPQRTSRYLLNNHVYPAKSKIFHEYAEMTNIFIDRGGERIALTYNIDVKIEKNNKIKSYNKTKLKRLINFSFERILKLNEERLYASHYCNWLRKFRKVSVSYNFMIKHKNLPIDMPEINDLVIPGESNKIITDYSDRYDFNYLLTKITESLGQ